MKRLPSKARRVYLKLEANINHHNFSRKDINYSDTEAVFFYFYLSSFSISFILVSLAVTESKILSIVAGLSL